MKHHDPATDKRAVENTYNAFGCLEPQLEKAFAYGAGVRHPEIGPVDLHPLCIPQEASNEAGGQREDRILECSTMKGDSPVHKWNIANTLWARKGKTRGRTVTRGAENTREGIGFTKAGTAQSAGRQMEARARMTTKTRPPEGPRGDRPDRKRGDWLAADQRAPLCGTQIRVCLAPQAGRISSRSRKVLTIRLSRGAAAQSLRNVTELWCDGGGAEDFFPNSQSLLSRAIRAVGRESQTLINTFVERLAVLSQE